MWQTFVPEHAVIIMLLANYANSCFLELSVVVLSLRLQRQQGQNVVPGPSCSQAFPFHHCTTVTEDAAHL